MRIEDIGILADIPFTLYRCSPLLRFISTKSEYLCLERIMGKALCDALDLYVEGQQPDPTLPVPSGKLYIVKFRPFEIHGLEHDNTYKETPVIRLQIEYQLEDQERNHVHTMFWFPALEVPREGSSSNFWFYPLMLAKVSNRVLRVVKDVFEKRFLASILPFHVPQPTMVSVINQCAVYCCAPILEDDMYIGERKRTIKRSPSLDIQYTSHQKEMKTIAFGIRVNQIIKMCSIGDGPEEFYTMFTTHIKNTTKIKLGAFMLDFVSCDIVTLTRAAKFKIHKTAPKPHVIFILEKLIQLAQKL